MMRPVTTGLLAIAVLLALAATAPAGEVRMKTGAILQGEILEVNEREVVIDIPELGRVTILREEIASMTGAPVAEPEPEPGPGPDPLPEPEPEPLPEPQPGMEPPPEITVEPGTGPRPEPTATGFSRLEQGKAVLLILKGEDHGAWFDSGRRILGVPALVGKKRTKFVFDSAAGVDGYLWVKKEEVDRVIQIEGHPERRILFLAGIGMGSWIEGTLKDGTGFEGRIDGISEDDVVTLSTPKEKEVTTTEVDLIGLRTLRGVVRGAEMEEDIRRIIVGEPIGLSIHGQRSPVSGRVVSVSETHLDLEVAQGPASEIGTASLFLGLPFTRVTLTSKQVRQGFEGVSRGDHLTVLSFTENEEATVRRAVTGTLVHATVDEITLLTKEGPATFTADSVVKVSQPAPDRIATLVDGKESSTADNILPVLPGMSRADVEKRLSADAEGIHVLYDGNRVAKVYCSRPFTGPVFGILIGTDLAKALEETDLAFDTQIDPKDPQAGSSKMTSSTLSDYLVTVFVARTGSVLALEIRSR